MVHMFIYRSIYQNSCDRYVPFHIYVCVCASFSTLVFVGSVDREACSILFAHGLKKHMGLAREHCDMNLLKASWRARIQPWDHESTKHKNTVYKQDCDKT